MTIDFARRLGQTIAQLRHARGLSQKELAEATGLHWVTIGKHENGHSDMTVADALRYAKALAVSLDQLASMPADPLARLLRPGPVHCVDRAAVRKILRMRTANAIGDLLTVDRIWGAVVLPDWEVVTAEVYEDTRRRVEDHLAAIGGSPAATIEQ